MNIRSDDELQEWLDDFNRLNRKPEEAETDDEALHLYQQLFDELSVEPPIGLSYGFSAAVVRQIQVRQVRERERLAYVWVGCCLLLMIGIVLSIQAVYRNDGLSETFRAIDAIKYPVVFIGVLLSLIQWADRRFVKRKLNSRIP